MIDDRWLGAQLTARGVVTQAQLDDAVRTETGDLCQNLVATGAVQEADLLKFLGLLFQTRYVTTEKLASAKIPQWVLSLVPLEMCEQHLLLPVRCDKQLSELSIVTTDPSDAGVRDLVQRTARVKDVRAYLGLRHSVEAAIRRFYKGDIHAFARMDQSLRQNYSEMLNIYEQRLIDFDQEEESPGGAAPMGSISVAMAGDEAPMVVTHEPAAYDPQYGSGVYPAAVPAAPAPPTLAPQAITPVPPPENLESLVQHAAPSPPKTGAYAAIAPETRVLHAEGFVHTTGVLVNMIESGQGWRRGHSTEVARIVGLVAGRAGVEQESALLLRLASLLHDLGKPTDPHLTLLALEASPDARMMAKKVFATPLKLLEAARLPGEVDRIVSCAYERFDGHGIPGKRYGREIPLGARIIAAVDAFCDLLSNPRAPGGRVEEGEMAVERLREATQRKLFDPDVVSLLHQVTVEAIRERLSGQHARILVIDSDLGAATVLEQKLGAAGYEARLARTTAEAALMVLSEKVDLILAEVQLEPVDGFVFLERVRADARTQHLPFIFVSDRAAAEDVNRGFELGALDYIVKPYTSEVLLGKIKRVLAERPSGAR